MLRRRTLLLAAAALALRPAPSLADELAGLLLEGGGHRLLLTPQDILAAEAAADDFGTWQVLIQVQPHAAPELQALSAAAVGQTLRISFRGDEVSAPKVMEALTGDSFRVAGLERVTAYRIAAFATYE